jgi:hypothetical protein
MQVTVEIMNEDAELIQQLLNSFGEREPCSNSHGNLDIAKLAQMLLEDVALAWRRPGSWEGANMSQVLTSHGYET